ncbi:DNA gyrase/topoisomerase IV, A subunit [Leptospira interrogans]|nr:DNA gyrase/topoisomerase IV, A subunit [Leptospira interrogans]
MKNSNPPKSKESFPKRPFEDQVNDDQRKYSRYVCDSRAIPHEIDGLKPVQRRILWAMWNSDARNRYTKTVKVAGLAMGYHPHGDKSIQDALSQMAQDFTFANNIPLVSGEGTFGDVLDPSAIASPRYTEVKLSDFVKDLGSSKVYQILITLKTTTKQKMNQFILLEKSQSFFSIIFKELQLVFVVLFRVTGLQILLSLKSIISKAKNLFL